MRCKWVLSALHFGPTPNGLRDEVPLELLYSHSGAQHSACFKLQCKLDDRHRPKARRKAQKHGKPFFCATCSFDAAKTQNTAAAQQWTFEEAVEDSTGAYTGSSSLASHRAPPKLVDEADSPDSQNNKAAKTEEAVELGVRGLGTLQQLAPPLVLRLWCGSVRDRGGGAAGAVIPCHVSKFASQNINSLGGAGHLQRK